MGNIAGLKGTAQDRERARRASYGLFTGENPTGWVAGPPPSLHDVDTIALDAETTHLKWMHPRDPARAVGWAYAFRRKGAEQITRGYLPMRHSGGNLDPEVVNRWMRTELPGKRITNLHVKFDTNIAYNEGVDWEKLFCRLSDVGHQAALLDDHRMRFSLDAIAKDKLGRGKVTGVDPTRMVEYHAGQVADYAMTDAELALLLDEKQLPAIRLEGLDAVNDLEDACLWPVIHMERNGHPVDEELLDRMLIESEQKLLKMKADLKRSVGFEVSPNSAEDIERLCFLKKIDVDQFTTRGMSIAEDYLRSFDHPDLNLVADIKKLDSKRTKYLLKIKRCVGEFGKLIYALNQLKTDPGDQDGGVGTITGRFSSTAFKFGKGDEWGINSQQTSKDDIRDLFIPGSGLYLSTDAMQIELRRFAELANDPTLNAAYAENPRVSYHLIVREMIEQYVDIEYKTLKNTNFAKLYGSGYKKVAATAKMGEAEAKLFYDEYDRRFPVAKRMLNLASKTAEQRGYVTTQLGRRSRFPKKCPCHHCQPRVRYYKALNGAIQGGCADEMKQKIVDLHAVRQQTGFVMRMTVHDQVTGDIPDRESAELVRTVLDRQPPGRRIPIPWDVKVDKSWGACDAQSS